MFQSHPNNNSARCYKSCESRDQHPVVCVKCKNVRENPLIDPMLTCGAIMLSVVHVDGCSAFEIDCICIRVGLNRAGSFALEIIFMPAFARGKRLADER